MSLNGWEVAVEIQGADHDAVLAEGGVKVGGNLFLSARIEEHAGDEAGVVFVQVLDVGEDLVEVAGVDGLLVELFLHHAAVVFGVDDEGPVAIVEGDISFHRREEVDGGGITVGDVPGDLVGIGRETRKMVAVVLQDELLEEAVHVVVGEGGHLVGAGLRCHEHTVQDEVADVHQHLVGLIVALEAQHVPVNVEGVYLSNSVKEGHQGFELILALGTNGFLPDEDAGRGLENLVEDVVFGQVVVFAAKGVFSTDTVSDGALDIQLALEDGEGVFSLDILAVETLLELVRDTFVENLGKQILDILEVFLRDFIIVVLPKLLESIGQHIVDVPDQYALVVNH